jgi:hypothetical protein
VSLLGFQFGSRAITRVVTARFFIAGTVGFTGLAAGVPLRADPPSFLLAATTVEDAEQDPLPAQSPDTFNPDPGGRSQQPTADSISPANSPAVPSLFEPILPPAPENYGTRPLPYKPVPYKLRLPRTKLVASPFNHHPLPYPEYELSEGGIGLLPNEIPETNRWRIPFGEYQRYQDSRIETPYQTGPLRLYDPYKPSLLKGDAPIIGQDIFLSMLFQDQFIADFRNVPVASGVSAARANSFEFFGQGDSYTLSNNLSATFELFKGETSFKPIDWAIRITPIFNINYTEVNENGLVNPDPRGPNYVATNPVVPPVNIVNPGDVGTVLGPGLTDIGNKDLRGTRYDQRTRETVSLEEYFVEVHLKDLDDTYDFISARLGSQLLNSDFRGFLFNDTNTGLRFFGNYDDNRLQYNAAYFNLREKDTFSELNQYSARGQDVFVANVYRQDALSYFLPPSNPLALGYTVELSFDASLDHGGVHYDKDGFLVRPAPVGGPIVPHDVNAYYLGLNGDGHIGWLNITNSFYQAFGRDQDNGIAGHAVDINAQEVALELSVDHDYLRPKFSLFYASGDSNPRSSTATGFDSILDRPTFIGSPFSFYESQGFGLAGSSLLTKTPDSLLLNLRTSKDEGQSNFVNPGTFLVGLGLDADLTPKLRLQFNANYIRFVNTNVIKQILFTNQVSCDLGFDISLGFTYRPLLTENIVINAGFGAFLPGRGYRDIYRELTDPVPGFTQDPPGYVDSFLYSGIIAVTFRF